MIRNPIQTLKFTFTNKPCHQIIFIKIGGYPKGPYTGPVKIIPRLFGVHNESFRKMVAMIEFYIEI